jgi:2,5-dioxopentanoate dehydrogenase
VARVLHGQLTATIIANDNDLSSHSALLGSIQDLCGRMIFNGVPTGVDVSLSMHHGGPFPASTDSRFTAVGADAIRRFARPLSYQDCPDAHLPPELQNENPLRFWRRVNNELTKDPVRV